LAKVTATGSRTMAADRSAGRRRSSTTTSWQGREVRWALAACAGFAVALALVAYFSGSWSTAGTNGPPVVKSADARPMTREDLGTGPILFMAPNGNTCRQRLIDNTTGQIRDNGTVDCEAALEQSSGRRLSGTRVDIIRDGFFKK
jgi:hypothetical protein